VAGSLGTCTTVASGQPHGSRAACAGSGTCAGSCNGSSATACGYPGSTVQCVAGNCNTATGEITPARFCNGTGTCSAAGATTTCSVYNCDPSTLMCRTSCSSDAHCVLPSVCTEAFSACGPTCFVAGTPVDTEQGPRAIETLRPGEKVRTFDELTGESSYAPVAYVEKRMAPALVRLTLPSGAPIVTSPEHQIWVVGSGWVRAAELELGDELMGAAPGTLAVTGLESVTPEAAGFDTVAGEGVAVYNVVVKGSPTYYVGEPAVLVHTCDYLNFSALPVAEMPARAVAP
jgi:hypothetical protein